MDTVPTPPEPERAIVDEAVRALTDIGATHETAPALLDSWARRSELADEDVAGILLLFPAHPSWCAQPPSEPDDECHQSREIACNPHGDEPLAVSVRYAQSWPPYDEYRRVWITIAEDGETVDYPLDLDQARVLRRALGRLLDVARRAAS